MPAPRSLACPLPSCKISAGAGAHFGAHAAIGGGIHTGLDLSAPIGTPVHAPAPGIVRSWPQGGSGGFGVEIQHNGFTTRYFHLSTRLARPGAAVALGQVFARSGASGVVTGPHLHFEVLADGQYVDPEPLLFGGQSSSGVDTSGGSLTAYPLEPGKTCPAGYNAGTIQPGILGNIPFNVWFNRPRNPDGSVNACIQVGLGPGDNAALAQGGQLAAGAFAAGLGAVLPVLINLGVGALVVVLAFTGAKQALSAGTV